MNVGTHHAYFRDDSFKTRGRIGMRTRAAVTLMAVFTVVSAYAVPLNNERRTPVVEVVEKISPSVVTIRSDVRKKVMIDPFESFGFRFFGGPGLVQERQFTSAGSGVIVDRQGTVVTNAHVVADANRLTCTTYDGEEHSLTLIGVDSGFDIAILQIDPDPEDPHEFHEIDWGSSRDLMIGEPVVVIGSALSFSNSVSVGVVSAVERTVEVPNREPYFGMIQTDAAINRGNSGGPLVNIRGELIGVTTLIATEGGGSDGIGFAIPVERVASVYNEFVHGIVSLEERLGIMAISPQTVEGIHPSQRQRLGLKKSKVQGIVLVKLHPEGLAFQAGAREGDLLIQVDGKKTASHTDLYRVLEEHEAGNPVILSVLRVNPQTGEVSRIPIKIPAGQLTSGEKIEQIDSWFGFEVGGLSNEVADRLGVAIDDGVVVKSVRANSEAHRAGIAPGDIIQAIDRWRIQTIGDFRRLRHTLQNWEKLTFRIRRGNVVGEVTLVNTQARRRRSQGL